MNTVKTLTIHLSLLVLLLSMGAKAASPNEPGYGFVDDFVAYVDENVEPDVPGAALVVVVDGKIKLVKSYGVRSVESGEPVTVDTVFRLASVSKTFASSAIALLVHDDAVTWNAPIQSYLKDVSFKDSVYGKKITLSNVLSHSSGLIQHAYTNLVEDNVAYERIVQRLKEVDFVCEPGTCYGYQNVVYSLTGDIVKSLTGESYEAFVKQRLFIPLGMTNASFGMKALLSAEYAVPHVWRNDQWVPVHVEKNFYNLAPAAGANASILDMGQWILAQLGQKPEVLDTTTLDLLHSKIIRTSRRQAHYPREKGLGEIYYGLGWRVFDFANDKNFVQHAGWVRGVRTEIVLNRERQIGMAFLTNSESRSINGLVFEFLRMYENSLLVQKPMIEPLNAENTTQDNKVVTRLELDQQRIPQ